MATIATHNGGSHRVRQGHNIRQKHCVDKEPHINPDGIHETWIHEWVRDAYKRIFGEAQDRYNATQERADRQIKDYYSTVERDERKHTAYELIIGVYGREVDDHTAKDIMRDFVRGWKKANPTLELVGAYYHADEEGKNPHVHLDYIPVAHGYRRGMDTQCGLVKALGEMGLHTKGKFTAQIQWEQQENARLEELCRDRGLFVEHPMQDKGVKHLETPTYKAQERLKELLRRGDRAETELDLSDMLNRALAPLEASQNTDLIPTVLEESPERTKTMFAPAKPATVTIAKAEYIKLSEYIQNTQDTAYWALRAAKEIEQNVAEYTRQAKEIHKNYWDSAEVAKDSRVRAAEDRADIAKDRAAKYEASAREWYRQCADREKEVAHLQGQIKQMQDIIARNPREWQAMVQRSKTQVKNLHRDVENLDR